MESLALLVVSIGLAITAVVFIPLLLVFRRWQKAKFPNLRGAWYVLWTPILLLIAYGISILVLVTIARWNGS